jgi:hypothetical protein
MTIVSAFFSTREYQWTLMISITGSEHFLTSLYCWVSLGIFRTEWQLGGAISNLKWASKISRMLHQSEQIIRNCTFYWLPKSTNTHSEHLSHSNECVSNQTWRHVKPKNTWVNCGSKWYLFYNMYSTSY